jgi:hypothetical protein
MGVGTLIGLGIGMLLAHHASSTAVWMLPHIMLVLPSAAQPWFQARPFKVMARTALGIASGSYAVGLLLDAPLPAPRLLSVAVFIGVFLASLAFLLWLRARKPNDPCVNCPLGVFPTCEWNLPRLLGVAPVLHADSSVVAFGQEGEP